MMTPLRGGEIAAGAEPDLVVGEITYANVTPIFHVLKTRFASGSVGFRQGVPAVLNGMLARGEIDLCPSSSIVYARSPEDYFLIPDLSISSLGPVRSVLLFSRVPLEDLGGRTVGITAESETSVILLRIILEKFHGLTPEYAPIPGNEPPRGADAFLLIGDAALRASNVPADFRVYDLGEIWHRRTGLPFVFALWIVRKEAVLDKGSVLTRLCATLRLAKKIAAGSLPEIAEAVATREMGAPYLLDYWKCLCYDLGDEHCRGLREFYAAAAGLGFLPGVPELRFVT